MAGRVATSPSIRTIGIDLSCWSNQRGYGRYTRNVVRALLDRAGSHRFVGFADAATAGQIDRPAELNLVTVRQSAPASQAAAATGRRRLLDVGRMSLAVARAGVDLMFFPSSYSYFPVAPGTRCVVVVHDAIAERWPRLIFPNRAGRIAWTIKSRLACWQATRVVTVSEAAARGIHDHLGVPRDRMRVVPEAADPIFGPSGANPVDEEEIRRRYRLPTDAALLLYVGGLSPHKNLGALLAAFARLTESRPPGAGAPHLALVGETTREVFHSEYLELKERVQRLGLAERVTFTGYVPDADLVHLYRSALGLILPSRDEGFGLPVVEAMACGRAVVASRAGALPEVVGDAGLLVDPDDTAGFADALGQILDNPALREELGRRGARRADELSWDQAALKLLAIFDDLTDAPGTRRRGQTEGSASWT